MMSFFSLRADSEVGKLNPNFGGRRGGTGTTGPGALPSLLL